MFADFRADPRWISAGHAVRPHRAVQRRYRGGEQRYAARPPGMAGSRGMARGIPGRPFFRSTFCRPSRSGNCTARWKEAASSRPARRTALEPLRLAPARSRKRGASPTADFVSIHNDRGRCHAYALIDPALHGQRGHPADGIGLRSGRGTSDRGSNPNVLTHDIGTSDMGQGCAAQSCLVDVELLQGELVRAAQPRPAADPRALKIRQSTVHGSVSGLLKRAVTTAAT